MTTNPQTLKTMNIEVTLSFGATGAMAPPSYINVNPQNLLTVDKYGQITDSGVSVKTVTDYGKHIEQLQNDITDLSKRIDELEGLIADLTAVVQTIKTDTNDKVTENVDENEKPGQDSNKQPEE